VQQRGRCQLPELDEVLAVVSVQRLVGFVEQPGLGFF